MVSRLGVLGVIPRCVEIRVKISCRMDASPVASGPPKDSASTVAM